MSYFSEREAYLGPREWGLSVAAPLGIGLGSWGDSATWGYGTYDPNCTEGTFKSAFEAAIAAGINLFDVSQSSGAGWVTGWGKAETILGEILEDRDSQVVLATKYVPRPNRYRQPRSMLNALTGSTSRLGVPRVALYQTLGEGLAECVRSGHATAAGVCNYDADQVRRTHSVLSSYGIPLATVQGERRFGNLPWEVITPVLDALRRVGREQGGKTPCQVALNWVMCKGAVPLVGAKSGDQVREAAGALGWPLSREQVAQLDAVAQGGTLKFGQYG